MPIQNLIRAAAVIAIAASAACVGGESLAPEATVEETTFASSLGVNLSASTRTASGAYYRDITVGPGAVIVAGDSVFVRYTGFLSNGTQIDSNVAATLPLGFRFGVGGVIKGFDEGLTGVRVGGKRQILVPPSLGYGPYDYGVIPGNSVLVFNIEVVSTKH